MKKRILSVMRALFIMLCMVQCFGMKSYAAEGIAEEEPNDASNTAMVIETDQVYTGELSSVEDKDWFKFTNDQDNFTLTFDISNVNFDEVEGGWNIAIYTSNGTETIKEYTGVKESFTTPILPFKGTYYIKIYSAYYNAPINLVYKLKINTIYSDTWEKENNDSSVDATEIKDNTFYAGVLYQGNDVDWFKLTNDQDNFTLTFDISNVNIDEIGSGWTIDIYMGNGTEIIKSYRKVKESFTTPILSFEGTYYVKVSAYNSYYAPVDCEYILQVNTTSSSVWEREKNDVSSEATEINTEEIYHGMLYKATDVDWYTFDCTKGGFGVDFTIDSNVSIDNLGRGWKMTIFYGNESITYPEGFPNNVSGFYSGQRTYKGKILIKVEAYSNSSDYAPVDCQYNLKITEQRAEAPKKVTAKLYGYNDVKVSWTKVNDAAGYYVYYQKGSGEEKLLKKTSKTSLKKANLSDGCQYTFRVVPYFNENGKTVVSLIDNNTSVNTLKKVSKPIISGYLFSDKVNVSWTAIDGATGYQISKSTNKNKISIVKKVKGKNIVELKAQRNKKYYYKVRAYQTVNGKKIYGPWSKVKSFKLK